MTQTSELWVHGQTGNRYIIPKEEVLDSGDYSIQSVTGRVWKVKFESVKPFFASDSDVQIFMMMDLKLALLQKTPTIHSITSDLDDSSEDVSEYEDDSSEDTALESALLEALGVNDLSSEKINDIFSAKSGLTGDLIRELEPEFEDLRDSVAAFGTALLQNEDASAAEILRALGEQLIAQADLIEADLIHKLDTTSE